MGEYKKMVEFDIKIHEKQRLAYIPRQVVKALGLNLKLVADFKAAVLYPEGTDPQVVADSLNIIMQDLELRARTATEERERKAENNDAGADKNIVEGE